MSTNSSREDWIDEDGDDCLPVFVTKHGEKYHKRDGVCEPGFNAATIPFVIFLSVFGHKNRETVVTVLVDPVLAG